MIQKVYDCSCQWKNQDHCQLSPSCKGWGCRFLSTPIEEIPGQRIFLVGKLSFKRIA